MSENTEVQRQPSRKERKMDSEINKLFTELETNYLEARALYGEYEAAKVLNRCDRRWKQFVWNFNKRNKTSLDPDGFLESMNASWEMEVAMLEPYKKVIQSHKFDRWLKIQKQYSNFAWFHNILEWVVFKLTKKSHWKKRYEKIQIRSSRRAGAKAQGK